MQKITLLSALILAAVTLAPMAEARGGNGERPNFEQIDADGNGELTADEIAQARTAGGIARFAEVDTNSDGELSVEELTAAAEKRQSERADRRINKMMERLDADESGTISQEEMAAMSDKHKGRHGKMIERMDADENGTVSKAEFDEAMEKFGDRKGRKGKRSHN